jgi:hypothetical protein
MLKSKHTGLALVAKTENSGQPERDNVLPPLR